MADWQASLESVAIGLLSLEVNTIRKCGMSAQKMPDVPIALHSIVECYADYLAKCGYGVTNQLLTWAANRMAAVPGEDWHANLMTWEPKPDMLALDAAEMTNGGRTFEALRWAAASALRLKVAKDGDHKGLPFPEEERAILARIRANCRQLSPVVLDLEKTYPPRNQSDKEAPVLIDGTLEQTARACFIGNTNFRPPLNVAVLVRKVWDIGDEIVLLQTSVQVDGDVVTRISPAIEDAQRDFLLLLHGESVKTGLGQWKALFDLVTTLIKSLGAALFEKNRLWFRP